MDSESTSDLLTSKSDRLHVVIVGGSIAGLMAGIVLRRRGHKVTVLEQSSDSERSGLAAGIGLSKQVKHFFDTYDRLSHIPLGFANAMTVRDQNMTITRKLPVTQVLTTWDVIYYRLRANFDSYASPFCPSPPATNSPTEGEATFRTGTRVQSVEPHPSEPSVLITATDAHLGQTITLTADYVLGADGANSTLRRQLLPSLSRAEPGYCIWRGTVPTAALSTATRRQLEAQFVAYQLPARCSSYAVLYTIPGAHGAVSPAAATELNFAWYRRYGSARERAEILTDADGHVHRSTLPKGKMRAEVWARQRAWAEEFMHPAVAEVVRRIEAPFVSVVGSMSPGRACFVGDRVCLIGDALFQVQPNSGSGSNLAAFGAMTVCEALEDVAGMRGEGREEERRRRFRDWEYKILDRGEVERVTSVFWGNILLKNWLGVLLYGARLQALTWRIRIAKWWRWVFRLGGDGPDGYEGFSDATTKKL